MKELGLTYPVVLDPNGDVLALFSRGGGISLTLIIDAKGDVIYRNGNFEAGDERQLEKVIQGVAGPGK